MKIQEKRLKEIRRMEETLSYATPAQAAKITGKLVKAKENFFSKYH